MSGGNTIMAIWFRSNELPTGEQQTRVQLLKDLVGHVALCIYCTRG